MAHYAFTDIKIGVPADGDEPAKTIYIATGEEVKGLPKETMQQLIETGAIATYDRREVEKAGGNSGDPAAAALAAQNAELRARVAELEGQGEKGKEATPQPKTDTKSDK